MDPTYPAVPIANLSCFIFILVVLPWQFKNWNLGVSIGAIWTGLNCLAMGINTIIWRDNVDFRVPVWCDIGLSVCGRREQVQLKVMFHRSAVTRLSVGGSIAVASCPLAVIRRLYNVSRMKGGKMSQREVCTESLTFDAYISAVLMHVPETNRPCH